jgi:translin
MQDLDHLTQDIHAAFDERTQTRDQVLAQARLLTRFSAHAIRAVHRQEPVKVSEHLEKAQGIASSFQELNESHPEIYFAGYTQDALKEYAEANLTNALVNDLPLPTPQALGVEYATYLKGLAETVGELRRRCLDLLLKQRSSEAERLLEHMDEIYAVLVTIDYPDAITGGLRRLTDIARSIIERTRGDLTMSLRQEQLVDHLRRMENRFEGLSLDDENG